MKNSQFTFIVFFLITQFFAASCSQPKTANTSNAANNSANSSSVPESNQPTKFVTVKINAPGYEPLAVTAEMKYGRWRTEKSKDDNFEFLRQVYCLSNVPNSEEELKVTPDGEFVRVCFAINENKRWDDTRPVAPAVYYIATDERTDMGRIASVSIQTAKGKERLNANIDPTSTYGSLTIEKAAENFVEGKLALSDKNFSVSGSFATNLQN